MPIEFTRGGDMLMICFFCCLIKSVSHRILTGMHVWLTCVLTLSELFGWA